MIRGEFSMNINELLQYNGASPCPEDIDKYWDEAVAEMKATAPDVELISTIPVSAVRVFTQSLHAPRT